MLYQPTQISPDELTGTGTVDLLQGLTVRWQPAGDSALTAYEVRLCATNSAGTQLYSTGKVSLADPFYGTDRRGRPLLFSVEIPAAALSSAGLRNGNDYQLTIKQWSGATETTQSTASVFRGRTTPVLTLNPFPATITGKAQGFTATYTQVEGDTLRSVRWQLAELAANGSRRIFRDTGEVLTALLETKYDGFLPDTDYSVRCCITTVNGASADTGWRDFRCAYEMEETRGSVTVSLDHEAGVRVCWSQVESAQGYTVLRQDSEEQVLQRLCDVDSETGELRDYTAKAGRTYTWYVFPTGHLSYLSKPMASRALTVRYPFWAILEADATDEEETEFLAVAVHTFRCGAGGVSEGPISNSNSPKLQRNFTRYPTRFADSACYLQGMLSGYCGSIGESGEWLDSADVALALSELSRSEHSLFLLDPRGRCLRIVTNGPVNISTDHRSHLMPQTVAIRWAECGSMEGISVFSSDGGDFLPVDDIIFTTLDLDPVTGTLTWTTDDVYDGSRLSLVDGILMQTTSEYTTDYTAARISLSSDGGVYAEV